MADRRNAVEASVSRAKQLGATSNLYIVEGDPHAYWTTSKDDPNGEDFNISTRSIDRPTRVGYLVKGQDQHGQPIAIDTLWPRPVVGTDWNKKEDDLWYKD